MLLSLILLLSLTHFLPHASVETTHGLQRTSTVSLTPTLGDLNLYQKSGQPPPKVSMNKKYIVTSHMAVIGGLTHIIGIDGCSYTILNRDMHNMGIYIAIQFKSGFSESDRYGLYTLKYIILQVHMIAAPSKTGDYT